MLFASKMARRSKILSSIEKAISNGSLPRQFTSNDFKKACPGFGKGTYNAFLWKHREGNPGEKPEYFRKIDRGLFERIEK